MKTHRKNHLKSWVSCILKSSIILNTKKMGAILVQCPYKLDCGLSEFWKKKKKKRKKKKKKAFYLFFVYSFLGGILCFKCSYVCI